MASNRTDLTWFFFDKFDLCLTDSQEVADYTLTKVEEVRRERERVEVINQIHQDHQLDCRGIQREINQAIKVKNFKKAYELVVDLAYQDTLYLRRLSDYDAVQFAHELAYPKGGDNA